MIKKILKLRTNKKNEILDITNLIENNVSQDNAMISITIPHTTAAVTVNENYDEDVKDDFIFFLNKLYPDHPKFKHLEGNSDSHIKASVIGRSENLFVINSHLDLGRWEGIWFCEFDGPRNREIWLYISENI